jgi:hypothetical protein
VERHILKLRFDRPFSPRIGAYGESLTIATHASYHKATSAQLSSSFDTILCWMVSFNRPYTASRSKPMIVVWKAPESNSADVNADLERELFKD